MVIPISRAGRRYFAAPRVAAARWFCGLTLGLAFAAPAVHAQAITFGPGGGGAIPDGGSVSSDIGVRNTGTIASFDRVTIFGLNHTAVGDLTATITHVDTGTTVDLFNRPGRTSSSEFDFGDDSNFNGNYTFTGSGPSLTTAAQQGNTSYNIPAGTYAISTSSVPGEANPNTYSAFTGESASGTWRLLIRDAVLGDVGSFTGWEFALSLDTAGAMVPEAGSLALALSGLTSAAGIVYLRRRRRRRRK